MAYLSNTVIIEGIDIKLYKNVYVAFKVICNQKIRKYRVCYKFSGLRTIVGFVGLVPSRHRAFVGSSWALNFFSWVFRGFKIFSRGQFRNFLVFFT